jgi:hypothetical protein
MYVGFMGISRAVGLLFFRIISFACLNLPGRSFPLLRLMLYECIYGIEEPSLYNPRLRIVSSIATNHLKKIGVELMLGGSGRVGIQPTRGVGSPNDKTRNAEV